MHDNYVVSSKQDILLFLTKRTGLKGTVHPKMNIRSSFTHPHVVSNLKDFPSSVEHQRCLKKCFGPYNRKSTGDNVAKKTMLFGFQLSTQGPQKKEIHTDLKQHEGE